MKGEINREPHYFTSSDWVNRKEIMLSGWPINKKANHAGRKHGGWHQSCEGVDTAVRTRREAVMQKITFAPYDADFKLLEQEVKDKQMVGLPSLVREIVGNWCVEKRASKRHTMPAHHYSMRNVEEYGD